MDIKIKRLVENAVVPSYAKKGDAGMDLTAVSVSKMGNNQVKYGFGLAVEIPEGYVGYVFPRSSCYKQNQTLSNCVGVIDSGYRGEISAIMTGDSDSSYKIGERVCQLIIMPIPFINFIPVLELTDTERGSGGYGSTGNK